MLTKALGKWEKSSTSIAVKLTTSTVNDMIFVLLVIIVLYMISCNFYNIPEIPGILFLIIARDCRDIIEIVGYHTGQ